MAFAGGIQFRSKSLSVVIKGWYINQISVDDVPFCNWTGVTCDNNTIVGLDMAAQGLNGESPHDGCSALQSLELRQLATRRACAGVGSLVPYAAAFAVMPAHVHTDAAAGCMVVHPPACRFPCSCWLLITINIPGLNTTK